MNAEYPPAHPGRGPWGQSPRGGGLGGEPPGRQPGEVFVENLAVMLHYGGDCTIFTPGGA